LFHSDNSGCSAPPSARWDNSIFCMAHSPMKLDQ
jgi:hypothetical protein